MLHINNEIWCFEYCEATLLMLAETLDDALDVALAVDDYCGPSEPCSYNEIIVSPFGTDELQCEIDRTIAKYYADFCELPF